MSFLVWVLLFCLLAFAAFATYLWGRSWAVDHKPDGQKSLAEHWDEEAKFPCSTAVAKQVKDVLLVFPPGNNQFPELDWDEDDIGAFCLLDQHHGYICIRTQEMCEEDQPPLFKVDAYSHISDDDASPFDSVEAEITYYLTGAKKIFSKLQEAGVEPPSTVMINGKNHQLRDST